MDRETYHLDDVYGVTRHLPLNYVARERVDRVFVHNLARDKHIVVFGSSKQGKTSLRKHCLDDDDYVVITCSNKWQTLQDLHTAVLKAAGYVVGQSTSKTTSGSYKITAKLEGKGGIPFLGHVKAGGEGGADQETQLSVTTAPLELDAGDVNDIIAALATVGFEKYILLEDFHYLPDETQRDFAVALKAFHENSQLCFIVIGVWLDENRLIQFNGDLAERVVTVNVDAWTREELEEVVRKGGQLLNVRFDSSFTRELIGECYASVSVLQVTCHEICEKAGIIATRQDPVTVGEGVSARAAVRQVIARQSARYEGFLQSFAGGFQESQLEMHRWLLLPLLLTPPSELRKGVSHGHIRRTISGYHPSGEVNPGSVTRALRSTVALQMKLGIKPIILDYDSSTRRLNVVDRGFLIWLAGQDQRSLLMELDLPQYPQVGS